MCLVIWHTDTNIQKLWIEHYYVYKFTLIKVTPAIIKDNSDIRQQKKHVSGSYTIQYQRSQSADSSSYLLLEFLPSKNASESSPFSQMVKKKTMEETYLVFRHFSLDVKHITLFHFYSIGKSQSHGHTQVQERLGNVVSSGQLLPSNYSEEYESSVHSQRYLPQLLWQIL